VELAELLADVDYKIVTYLETIRRSSRGTATAAEPCTADKTSAGGGAGGYQYLSVSVEEGGRCRISYIPY